LNLPPCGTDDCLLSGGCEILMFEYMNIKFCKFPLSEFDRGEGKKVRDVYNSAQIDSSALGHLYT
jgi:hypothetical protein